MQNQRSAKVRLVLVISDTGKGFDPAEARKKGGLGLVSMEERVRLVDGSVSIKARPGHGAQVTIQMPMNAGAQ
jgi:signal transduction histidine kinase